MNIDTQADLGATPRTSEHNDHRYEYQRHFSEQIPHKKGILALDTGLGKTKIIIDGVRDFPSVTVVAPAMLVANWKEEFQKWGYKGEAKVFSYHQLNKFFVSEKLTGKENPKVRELMHPEVLIFDEAHFLRSHGAERTKLAAKLCRLANPHTLWFVTATPILRSAENLYPICFMLDRKKTPILSAYREAFCEKKRNHFAYNGIEYSGVKLGFWSWFQTHFTLLRLRKDDVLRLPEKTYESIAIEVPPEHHLESYHTTVEEVEAKLLANKGETYAEMRRGLGRFKATQAVKTIKELQQNRPAEQFIVFAYHREVVTWLSTELNAEKIYGETPMATRERIIKAFQQGHFKALVCSYGAAGVGITLTAATRLYWVEKPYLFAEEKQAEDRIHRIGQEHRVQIINLYCPKTIDVSIERNLRIRQELHDDMFNRTGKSSERW